jgi:HAUS augmin-like complex subunit 1
MEPLDLLPTALFSPSKAAQQRAQAQEWHQVDTWLSAKYQGRSVPAFERTDETLKALLALSSANEKADEERDLLWNVQKEALGELKTVKDSETKSALTTTIVRGLGDDGTAALDALASAAVTLDVPEPSLYSLAAATSVRSETSQALAQQLQHLTQLQKMLEAELQTLRAELHELRSPAYQPPLSLQRQTQDWIRNTKQLRAKLSEYSDRIASMPADSSEPEAAAKVVDREILITKLALHAETLAASIKAYKGLPTEKELAIKQVKGLEAEVTELRRRLDSLFEGLVEKT